MSIQPEIHVFSKSNCGFCTRAKSLLKNEGLEFIEHDIEASRAMAAASSYYSGRVTVPQIFIGNQHINGAEELEALNKAGLLQPLLSKASGELSLDPSLEETWTTGAEDFTIASVLDKVDLTDSLDDPENLIILHFYKGLFGYSPISYLYLAIWPEAYKACALSNVIATYPMLMMQIGLDALTGVTYAASQTQGCAYCTLHAAAKDGVEQTDVIKELQAARNGNAGTDNAFGALEVAMVELAEQATLNKVTDEQILKITELAKEGSQDPQNIIEAVGLGAEIMALLNIFNDLVNVELEGGMASVAAKELGLEGGRHATADSDPDDLNFELPEPELTIETALAGRREKAADWQGLAQNGLGYIPNWLNDWPKLLQPIFAGMYTELMRDVEISAELKQLMARVSAIAKGHPAVAASAAVSAHHAAKDKDKAIERIRDCFAAATDASESDLFTPAEKLALRFAWLSAQTPIVTPAQFVKPLTDHYSQRQIVELCVACGMACAVQRMAATIQLQMGTEEAAFCRKHSIETDGLLMKYPLIAA